MKTFRLFILMVLALTLLAATCLMLRETGPVREVAHIHSSAIRSESLPEASSALPLVSVIGFGVLIGGVISALKTR